MGFLATRLWGAKASQPPVLSADSSMSLLGSPARSAKLVLRRYVYRHRVKVNSDITYRAKSLVKTCHYVI